MPIGNNVSIAANLRFITHDIIQSMFCDMNDENYSAGTNRFYREVWKRSNARCAVITVDT